MKLLIGLIIIVKLDKIGSNYMYSQNFLNSEYCIEKPHVYRYDFTYNNTRYHYVGSTIHSQLSRVMNHYPKILTDYIKSIGREAFLAKYCTIIGWFESDQKIEMTDLEEKLNIEAKQEFGEEFVLSINNGRKPSKQCIEAAEKAQKNRHTTKANKKMFKD